MGPREALLEGARRCLEERGYARTTARDLAAASGTGLASIGYHFGSKEALLDQALSAAMTEWTDRTVAAALAVDADAPPWQRLRASMEVLSMSFADQRPLMVAFVEGLGRTEREPQLRRELASTYDRIRGGIGAVVTEQLAGLPPERGTDLASLLIAITDGMLVQWMLDPDRTPSGGAMVDALGSAIDAGLSPPTAS